MAKLFISYRHGTDGIQRLLNALRSARYEYWIDEEDIVVGSPDWQQEIVKGISECAGVIVCLTLDAWAYPEWIRFEVEKAKEKIKRDGAQKIGIFPVILQKIPSHQIQYALAAVSLEPSYDVEDLSTIDGWDERFRKLVAGLEKANIQPTGYSFLEMVEGFDKAYQDEDYDLASKWLDRIQQAGFCGESGFDCDYYRYLVGFRSEEAAEQFASDSLWHEYDLIKRMHKYALYSHIWEWLRQFLDSTPLPDVDSIADKIREQVGIEPVSLGYEQNDGEVSLSWELPQRATGVEITRTELRRYVPDPLEIVPPSPIYGNGEGKWVVGYAAPQIVRFDRYTKSYIDSDVQLGSAYIYQVVCVYSDQAKKPLLVEEEPIVIEVKS